MLSFACVLGAQVKAVARAARAAAKARALEGARAAERAATQKALPIQSWRYAANSLRLPRVPFAG